MPEIGMSGLMSGDRKRSVAHMAQATAPVLDSTRRQFITLLGGAAVAWPLAARAQLADRVQRIGVLMPFVESDPEGQRRVNAFLQGLKELGWIRGRNVQIDYRWVAGDDADRIRVYTAELVDLKPDVIVCQSTHAVVALKKQTRIIPVVFAQVTDPVGNGIVEGLARPGGNITGFTNFEFSMGGKWIEVLKEIDPRVARVAVIFNPDTAPHAGFILRSIEVAAPSFAAEPIAAPLHDAAGIESALAALGQRAGGGVIVMPDAFTTTHRDLIVALAARHHVPAIYPFRYMIAAGGLISYGERCTARDSTGSIVCRSHPQRDQAWRSSGPAANQIRAGH
jgi:putative ABC transport system substrate-binding protein